MKKQTQQPDIFLKLVSDGDRSAFARFYNLYYEQVFRFAYYFLQDKDSCSDVVTEVFFGVWQSRKRLIDIVNVETYLYVATRNEVMRYEQRYYKHKHVSIDEIPIQLEEDEDYTADETMHIKEMDALLTKAINKLPDKCRQIFLMSRQEGLKTKEIAEILSLNESTVRVQMKIAIEKLTNTLKPHLPHISFSSLISLF